MHERWRKPAEVIDIQPVNQGIWLPDGRILGEVQITMSEETVERIRNGHMCAKCLEPFENAWPERCHVCGVSVRRDQAEHFAREFDPTIPKLQRIDDGGIYERVEEEQRRKVM